MFLGFDGELNTQNDHGRLTKAFAEGILGRKSQPPLKPKPALPILQAWCQACDPSIGSPAAMGPITFGNVCDVDDFYFGRGKQGLSIAPQYVTGWWYYSSGHFTAKPNP
jgi:hypothetical protein